MDDFHDVRFPLHLGFGSSGGPNRPTEILQLANESEVRNAKGKHSRRSYNIVAGLNSISEATELLYFFESRFGPLCGFRFRDPLDHASGFPISASDQVIGMGDGVQTEFGLIKIYGAEPYTYERPISKPVEGSVIVAVDAVQTAVSVNYFTGQIMFAAAPPVGAIISAGFEFDVPVRFGSEALDIALDDFEATKIQDIPLVEILYPQGVSHG